MALGVHLTPRGELNENGPCGFSFYLFIFVRRVFVRYSTEWEGECAFLESPNETACRPGRP